MDGLFTQMSTTIAERDGLGRSALTGRRLPAEWMDVSGEPADVRRTLRDRCARSPGVYGMFDALGDLIYVGMSCRLRDRLLTYFTKGPPEAKEQRVGARAVRLTWEKGDHELIVRLRELELIRRWRPRFNAVGRPGRREIGYIYLSNSEAPSFRCGRQLPRQARRIWGPIPLPRRVRGTVKWLNHLFSLRDCPERTTMRFVDQLSILPDNWQPSCLRGEVGTCLAPCAGDRSRGEYYQRAAEACAFLDGLDCTILDHYEAAMKQAALEQRYEQAAAHRDSWQSLSKLWEQLEFTRRAGGDLAGVHLLHGCSGKTWWALIAGGRVVRIVRQPASRRVAQQTMKLMTSNTVRGASYESDDFEQMQIVASWYRHKGDKTFAIIDFEQAKEMCAEHLK